jgi:hypothetical protein
MPTTINEQIRSRQESLDARLQTARETIRHSFLEQATAILEAQRVMKQELREGLRGGLEREALAGTLANMRSQAERAAQMFRQARVIFEGDGVVPAIESQLGEAEDFLTWVRDLETRVAAPIPPFDESRLSPASAGVTAEGYISISEARARVGRKP